MICYLPVYFVHKDEAEQIVGIATLLTKLSVGIPHPALACSIDAASNGATAHEHAAQLEAQYTDVLALGALTKSEEFFCQFNSCEGGVRSGHGWHTER